MKALKKTALIILALAMALTCVLPVFAADKSSLSMSVSKTSVTIGDTVTVTVKLNGEPEFTNFIGGVNFDKDFFECTSITNGDNGTAIYVKSYDPDDSEAPWHNTKANSQSTISQANSKGAVGFTFQLSTQENTKIKTRYTSIMVVVFKAKQSGSAVFSLYDKSSLIVSGSDHAYKMDPVSGSAVTVTIKNAPVTISFNANGHGTAPAAISVEGGKTAKEPDAPSAEGWDFKGWYKEAACTNAFDWSKAVTKDITLYAKWEEAHVHTLVHTAAKAADCEHDGNIEYWTCSDCKNIYSDAAGTKKIKQSATVVKALGHDWDKGEVTTEPTCDAKGVKTFHCTRCDKTKTEDIKALGHKWDEGTVTKEPVCDVKGEKTFTCTVCGKTKVEDVKAPGHDWTDVKYTWNKDNTKVTATAVCSKDETHKLTETVTTTRTDSLTPCGQEGTAKFKATFKNKAFTDQTKTVKVASMPHSLKHYDAVAVTCEDDGRIEYWHCTVCGKYFSDDGAKNEIKPEATVIEAQGHDIQGPEWTWAKDYSTATAAYFCTKCDFRESADAVITSEGDLRIATADMATEILTDIKRIPSDDAARIRSAKNASGMGAWVAMLDTENELLTPEKAAAAEHEELEGAKAEDIQIVWQKELKPVEANSRVTMTFEVDGAGEGKEILAYRFDAANGWQLAAFEKGSDTITVTIDGEQEVALAIRQIFEEQTDPVKPVDPSDPGKDVPDRSGGQKGSGIVKYAAIGVGAIVVIAAAVLFLKPGKGKHYN